MYLCYSVCSPYLPRLPVCPSISFCGVWVGRKPSFVFFQKKNGGSAGGGVRGLSAFSIPCYSKFFSLAERGRGLGPWGITGAGNGGLGAWGVKGAGVILAGVLFFSASKILGSPPSFHLFILKMTINPSK